MKIMITGSAGFVGGFLERHCLQAGCSVLGIDIKEPRIANNGTSFELCDVRDVEGLQSLISRFRPDRIFHLAAQSYPTVSLQRPGETMETNAGGTVNLFECVRTAGILPMIVVACSSAEYGTVSSADLPVREDHQLCPLHPYGVSKVAQDLLAAQYFYNYSIPAIRIRIFNTTGPGKIGDVCADLTQRAVQIEMGLRSRHLPAGNVTSRRAILDVRDLVRALWLSSERCKAGEVYNVASNQIYSVNQLIEVIRAKTEGAFEIEQDRSLMRGCDEPVIAGDTSKFCQTTGWKQEMDLTRTLEEMLDWWRNQPAAELTLQESEAEHQAVDSRSMQ